MEFTEALRAAAAAAGIALSEAQLAAFTRYYELLIAWNEKMNLTAITAPGEVAVKHIIDSLAAYDAALFGGAPAVIDVGTGAGFPGLPLKIFAPSIRLTLMDSLGKRVRFLETVVSELGLTDVACIHARAEEAARAGEASPPGHAVGTAPSVCEEAETQSARPERAARGISDGTEPA